MSIFLFLPVVFTEFDVASAEREALRKAQEGASSSASASASLPRPDMVVMVTLLINFCIYIFNFTLVEV